MFPTFQLNQHYDSQTGRLSGSNRVERYLSDLKGCFADEKAYKESLSHDNPLLYAVESIEPTNGEGDLHYGIGVLYPGKVGSEYFMTKGHFHAWRPASEIYVGLGGSGLMLLEDEESGASKIESLNERSIVYIPGHTAHRTVNIGTEPLVYIGIYSAKAGHDYGSIAKQNFLNVVVEQSGKPTMLPRKEWNQTL